MGDMFGSKTTTTTAPQYFTDAAGVTSALGAKLAAQGYTPYQGPEVAAQTQGQTDARQSTNNWMAAFGLAPKRDVSQDVPAPNVSSGGINGYSSYPIFQDQLEMLKKNYPGLYKYIKAMAIDPVGGAKAPTPAPVVMAPVNPFYGNDSRGAPATWGR